jgi:predicted AAA+ superfamily ATPase
MIQRNLEATLQKRLTETPVVTLTGPRHIGKTTLAMKIGAAHGALYLDLESRGDLALLTDPELFLRSHPEELMILDEVHRMRGLFKVLDGLIENGNSGAWLLLGSASPRLFAQADAGSHLELTPFTAAETRNVISEESLWLRGGFPDSALAPDDLASVRWREGFIRTYLERDVLQFAPRTAPETLRRFWTMLAHNQGGVLNLSQLARSVGVDVRTAGGYVDLLENLLLIRRLAPYHANVGKRLVKSPKVYVRDSGVTHTLLGISTWTALLSHPVVGASWEGFAIENLIIAAGPDVTPSFYRTSGGAGLDLLLEWPDSTKWAIEVTRRTDPRPTRGFYEACADVMPARKFVVYPGSRGFELANDTHAISLIDLADALLAET